MTTIETTGHLVNGVLRVEVPLEGKDQDVPVTLLVSPCTPETAVAPAAGEEEDPYRELREKIARDPEAFKGIHLPPPGSGKYKPFKAIDLPGPTATEILMRDRR